MLPAVEVWSLNYWTTREVPWIVSFLRAGTLPIGSSQGLAPVLN